MSDNVHSPKSPSGLKRVFACPASYWLSMGKSTESSKYAEEGTLAHDLAARMLLGEEVEFDDPEMERYVTGYVNYCKDRAGKEYRVEQRIESDEVEDLGGTMDFVTMYVDDEEDILSTHVLHVIDLKYGQGKSVEARDNPQLLAYLFLARERYGYRDLYRATIYQPRTPGEPETVTYYDADLDKFKHDLTVATDPANKDEFEAGGHCGWCPALQECPHLHQIALDTAESDFDTVVNDESKWKAIMDAKPAIEALLKEVPKRIAAKLESGGCVDGFKLVKGYGNRKWNLSDEEVLRKLANKKIGKKVATESKLKSPAKMEKLGYGDAIAAFVERPETGPRLVRSTDKRPALEFQTPEEVFAEEDPKKLTIDDLLM